MLKKKHRFNLGNEFNAEIFKLGAARFFKTKYFLIYLRNNEECLKMAAVAPKRLFKKAVERTKARSLLYLLIEEIFKEQNQDFNFKKDLVIVYRVLAKKSEKDKMKADLSQFLPRFLENENL